MSQSSQSLNFGFVEAEIIAKQSARKFNARVVYLDELESFDNHRNNRIESRSKDAESSEHITSAFRLLFGISFNVIFLDTAQICRNDSKTGKDSNPAK